MEEYLKIKSDFDGLQLDVLLEIPEKVKGIVQIAHGMAEYKERYLGFMKFLCANGYVACINDHRGHGNSVKDPKDLGYFYDKTGKAIVDDVHQITLYLKERFPNVPVILFGHSMGSFVVRAYTRLYDKDIDKLVVCGSPSYNSAAKVGVGLIDFLIALKGERNISKMMVNMATGGYDKPYAAEGHNAWLSVNKENVEKYNNDPKCGFPFTLNGYRNLMVLMQDAYAKDGWKLNNKDLPVLFISGSGDPCAESKEKWQEAIADMKSHGYNNVTGKMYEGYRHEILLDDCKEEVMKDVLEFINK